MMTRTEWYDRPRDAQAGMTYMEDAGWQIRQVVNYTGANAIPNFVVVYERDIVKR